MNYAIVLTLVVLCTSVAANGSEKSNGPPDWFLQNIQFMTVGSGTWIADNSVYKSDEEDWDAYVIEWQAGPGGHSMSGQMFGLTGCERSKTSFWLFTQFWDPIQKAAAVQQYGWGVVGIGTMEQGAEDGAVLMQQTFTSFDGTSSAQVHQTSNPSENVHRTISFDLAEDGQWIKRRSYDWVRQPPVKKIDTRGM